MPRATTKPFRALCGVTAFSAICCLLISAFSPRVTTGNPQSAKSQAETKLAESRSAGATATKRAQELTATDLEAFLDGFMPQQIESADIAGAVVAVVKDGKPLFAKGYGYADAEKKIPVSPENTLFRPGSISKLFTWTSVMQQVEQGKLDLDRDVNEYLDFKVPPAFGKPITLRDIMTHRPGFEETLKDLFVQSEKDLRPISQYLVAHMPARIFAPGTVPAYSNYATTLAAYIVQRVSGQPFDDYVEQHVLNPLHMAHATFRQPLPDSLKPLMSNGYQLASGGAKSFEYVEVAPAGSLSASAEAMTHMMIAHLQNGRYGEAQILKPETAIQMHTRQQGWPPAINAMCLGFYEESRNGQRIIGHGGDTQYFHSDMHLLLDSNVGFFVSYNSAGRAEVSPRSVLFDKFMERYFPGPQENQPTSSTAAEDARTVAGSYVFSRRFETNVLSILSLAGEAKISADSKDSTLVLPDFKEPNGQPRHYREIGPLLFQAVDGHEKIVFQNDASGRRVAYIDYPFMILQHIDNPLDKQSFNFVIIGFSLGVILLHILLWPVAGMLRKHYGKPITLTSQALRLRLLIRFFCLVDLAFVIGLALLASGLQKFGTFGEAMDLPIHLLQMVGVLCGIGALVAIYGGLQSWRDAGQWVWYKIWNTMLALGCAGFFWFIYHWHLLNFNLNY